MSYEENQPHVAKKFISYVSSRFAVNRVQNIVAELAEFPSRMSELIMRINKAVLTNLPSGSLAWTTNRPSIGINRFNI